MDDELALQQEPEKAAKERKVNKALIAGVLISLLCIASIGVSIVSIVQVNKMNVQVNKTNTALKAFEKDINPRLNKAYDLLLSQMGDQPAILSSDSLNSYSVASCSLGFFPIVLENVEPYLDGYKLKIKIANLTSADISDYKIRVKNHATSSLQGESTWAKGWDKVIKDFTPTNKISAGSWGYASLVIQPAKAEDLQIIEIWIEPNTIHLKN